MARDLLTRIILHGAVNPSLRNAFRIAESDVARAQNRLERLSKVSSKVFSAIGKTATIGAGVAVAGLGMVAKNGIQLASDLQEVQNVVDVTFGKSSDTINKWSTNALNAYGLSELQAKKFSGTMGAMLKSSGLSGQHIVDMSTKLTGLAGDFASFYNLDHQDAFDKIRAGIAGETEPLKQLGINMSVANLEAYALSKGINVSYQKMDQASQTALRYSYLLSVSKDAQGDFARTQDSFANQQRLLKTNFEQLTAKIATVVLPVLTQLAQKANKMMAALQNNPQKMKQIQDAVKNVATEIVKFGQQAVPKVIEFANFVRNNWPTIVTVTKSLAAAYVGWKLIQVVNGVVQLTNALRVLSIYKLKDKIETLYLQALYAKDAVVRWASVAATWAMTAATTVWTAVTTVATTVASAFSAAIAFICSPIGLVILAITAVIGIVILLYKNWDTVSKFLVGIWKTYVMPFFASLGAWFVGVWNGIVSIFRNAWNGILNFTRSVCNTVSLYISTKWTAIRITTMNVFNAIVNFFRTWAPGILTVIMGPIGLLVGFLIRNWSNVKSGAISAFSAIGSFVKSTVNGVKSTFRGMISGVISGLNTMIRGLNRLHVTIPDWVPGLGGKSIGFSIPTIPMFAKGGFTNQPSIFGEAGPEAAIPIKRRNPRSIALLNKTAEMLGVQRLPQLNLQPTMLLSPREKRGTDTVIKNASSGNTFHFTFAPVIHGGSVSENKSMLAEAMDDFESRISYVFSNERRLAFNE